MPRKRKGPLPPVPDGYKKGKPKTPDWRYRQWIPDWRGDTRPPRKPQMRRRAFRQKPWNKVTRMEKFWVESAQLDDVGAPLPNNNTPVIVAGAGTLAVYAKVLVGEQLAANYPAAAASPGLRALQHVKLHRFQGHMWCWLDPATTMDGNDPVAATSDSGGTDPPPNIAMLQYMWIKLDEEANFNTLNNPLPVGSFNPRPGQDMKNLMQRDDIISWGTLPVFGIIPRMMTTYNGGDNAMVLGNTGMYLQPHVAKIPWPRIPKTGFSLKKGQNLSCIVAQWPGPASANSGGVVAPLNTWVPRDVHIYDMSRMLCSI